MKTIYECIFDSSINDEIDYLSKESKELIYCKVIDIIKIKVTEALEQASDLATKFLYISIDSEDEDYYKKEILNAYNLENIKENE